MTIRDTIIAAHPDWGVAACQAEEKRMRRELLAGMDDTELVAVLERRGHADLARLLRGRSTGMLEIDDEEGVIAAFLGKRWPIEGGDDEPLPMVKMEDATALYDAQAQRWVGPLGKKWPPLADEDV